MDNDNVTSQGSRTPFVLLGLGALLIIGAVVFVASNNSKQPQNTPAPSQSVPSITSAPATDTPTSAAMEKPTAIEGAMQKGALKTVSVNGSNFKFSPAQIQAKKGDTVKVTFTSVDGTHDFVIDELGVKSDTISGGQTTTVSFVASKAGTFEYYCSIGKHRAMGMVGNLIVE